MLNIQQTKVLTALVNSAGITENFDHHVDGYSFICPFEVIEQLEEITGLEIEEFDLLTESSSGLLREVTSFRLKPEHHSKAKTILNAHVDELIRNGHTPSTFQ
ncbi:hypothetical protein ACMXYO_01120 [Neptuniibacter sp. QD37_6]|uniref:hypothetical protein n=1 Tax=Neptuniibacter sp. QD37_6 TaxID=3398210 RepID=UPI0039F5A047